MKTIRYVSLGGRSYSSCDTILNALPRVAGSQDASRLIFLTCSNS